MPAYGMTAASIYANYQRKIFNASPLGFEAKSFYAVLNAVPKATVSLFLIPTRYQ